MIKPYKTSVALLFSAISLLIAITLIALSVQQFTAGFNKSDWNVVPLIIKSINTLIIALAMYEPDIGAGKEYIA
ncbi:MAG: hypothetical protein V7745_00980 [Pseudomonadales bacterium]